MVSGERENFIVFKNKIGAFPETIAVALDICNSACGGIHRREVFGEPACKYEFGQCVLSRIKEPLTKFSPKAQRVIFLGFAPDVTNGYFVIRT